MIDEGSRLFRSFCFEEAVAAYQRQISDSRGNRNRLSNIDGLGRALMAVGRYAEAIPYLTQVGAHQKSVQPGSYGCDVEISICVWLTGDQRNGLSLMRSVVFGLRDGSNIYARDLVGGLIESLLLHYMAISTNSEEDTRLANDFIRNLLQSKKARHWPGPVGQLLLGAVTIEDALESGIGVRDIALASRVSASDLLKRRHLTNILFNTAVAYRMAGDEPRCLENMRACAALQNPLVEYEWYLAKAEANPAVK